VFLLDEKNTTRIQGLSVVDRIIARIINTLINQYLNKIDDPSTNPELFVTLQFRTGTSADAAVGVF
jgi:hypothetical protein